MKKTVLFLLLAFFLAACSNAAAFAPAAVTPTATFTPTATITPTLTPTVTMTPVPTEIGTVVPPSLTPDVMTVVRTASLNEDGTFFSAVLPLNSKIILRNGTQELLVTYTQSVSVQSDVTIIISSGSDKIYECENCYPNHGETIDTGFGVDYVVGDYSVTIIFPSDWEVEK